MNEIAENERLTPAHYLAVRPDGLTFLTCVQEAAGCRELIEQVDRIYHTNLLQRGSPIDIMIDEATGRADSDKQTFLRFVWNCVFIRCEAIGPQRVGPCHLCGAENYQCEHVPGVPF